MPRTDYHWAGPAELSTDVTSRARQLRSPIGDADPSSARTAFGSPTICCSAAVGLALCIAAIWMLVHPYLGLVNDATLYALAALARLHPGSLGHDIFLSDGSQNGYTIFSPLIAPLFRLIGVGKAASVITLASQVMFFGSCALVAHRLMPASFAILSIGLFVALPGLYGPAHIFWYSETLMTPRVCAEAFVMGALACALEGRYALMMTCLAVGMLLHPIMAMAGIVFLSILMVGTRRPWLIGGLAAGGLVTIVVWSRTVPFGPLSPFDRQWFGFLHERMQYLFPSLWSLRAWGRMAIPSATLIIGALTVESRAVQLLCRAALCTGFLGLVIALFGSDLSHVVIVTQAQTWRWLWLSNALAVLLLPVVGAACWRAGATSRAALVLVGAGWISFDLRLGGLVAIAAVAAATLARLRPRGREGLALLAGSAIVLLVSITALMAAAFTSLPSALRAPAGLSPLQSMSWAVASRWLPWARGGVLPACGFLALWWVAVVRPEITRSTKLFVVMVGVVLCFAVGPFAWNGWTNFNPSRRAQAQFAPWRRAIPPGAEVLSGGAPIIQWFDLERPSYWSIRQMAGAVFSRDATMELLRREALLQRMQATANPEHDLDALCTADSAIGFVVTRLDMGPTPFNVIPLGGAAPSAALRLYSCSAHRNPPVDVAPGTAVNRQS